MTAPIFVVGANRSGTTLLRLMLNAHSRIAIPEELVYFNSDLAGVPITTWRAPKLSESAYQAFVTGVLDTNPTVLADVDRDALEAELRTGPRDLRRPYAHLLTTWAQAQGKPRWGEKTPGNLFFVDVLLEMFPDAQFVHVVRDPRAGVTSMQGVDFFPDNVCFNALSRAKHHRVAARFEDLVPADQWTSVRYEDLVSDAESVLRDLCAFLGESFEPAMLRYHRSSATFMKADAASSFNAAATRPVTTAMVDKWRQQLSAPEVGLVETICRAEMERYSYAPTDTPLASRDRVALWVHRTYWILQQWRNRKVREYTVKSPMFARFRSRLRAWIDPQFPAVANWIGP
jgi:hypothetical protein